MSRIQSNYQTHEEAYSKEKAISGERFPGDLDVGVGGQELKKKFSLLLKVIQTHPLSPH